MKLIFEVEHVRDFISVVTNVPLEHNLVYLVAFLGVAVVVGKVTYQTLACLFASYVEDHRRFYLQRELDV